MTNGFGVSMFIFTLYCTLQCYLVLRISYNEYRKSRARWDCVKVLDVFMLVLTFWLVSVGVVYLVKCSLYWIRS